MTPSDGSDEIAAPETSEDEILDEGAADTGDVSDDGGMTDEVADDADEPAASAEEDAASADASLMSVQPMAGDAGDVTGPESATGFTYTPGAINSAGDYVFTVTPDDGYTVTVQYKVGTDGTAKDADEVDGEDNKYSIPKSVFDELPADTKIAILVTATLNTYKVTVKGADSNVTVKYGIGTAAVETAITDASKEISGVEHNSKFTLSVTPDEGYVVTVTANSIKLKPGEDNTTYTIDAVKADTTITIAAEKISYTLTSKVVKAEGQEIADADLAKVKVEWVSTVTVPTEGSPTIAKDTDLRFKVTLPETPELRVVSVKYGTASEQNKNPLVRQTTTGTEYVISKASIKANGDVTIKVEVRNLGTSTIKVATNANVAEVIWQKSDIETTEIGTNGVGAAEDTIFNFTVEPKKYFKVTGATVKAGSDDLTVTTGGTAEVPVYSFTVTDAEATTITVDTELDPKQCAQLAFKLEGDPGTATAVVEAVVADGETASGDITAVNKTLKATGEVIATRDKKVTVTVSVPDDLKAAYKVTSVKKAGETTALPVDEGKTNEYTIILEDTKTYTLEVTTAPIAITADKTVTFDITGDELELVADEVKADDAKINPTVEGGKIYKLEGSEAAAGPAKLSFVVNAKGSFKPTVKYGSNKELTGTKGTTANGTTPYTYSVAAALLGETETITITASEIENTINVTYDEDLVSVSADINGKLISGDVDEETGVLSYTKLAQDAKVNIVVEPWDNVKITAIKVGDTPQKVASKGATTFTVTASEATTNVTVEAIGNYILAPLKVKGGDVVSGKNNSYDVSYNGEYVAAIVSAGGTFAPVELDDVTVTEGTGKNVVEVFDVASIAKDDEDKATIANIKLSKDQAGKTLTVALTAKGQTLKYTLKVSKAFLDGSVKINNGKDITQAADTVGTYNVSVNSGADVKMLKAKVSDGSTNVVTNLDFDAKGQLVVTTGFVVGKPVTLEFYTEENGDQIPVMKNADEKLTVSVTATNMLDKDKTAAPKVTLKSATDVSLKLGLDAKASKLTSTANGGIFYEINVTPKAEGRPTKIKESIDTMYVPASAPEAVVYVGSDTSKDGLPALGQGVAWDFDVEVKLVQAKVDEAASVTADNKLSGSESKPFEAKGKKAFKTQTPIYESALKLKNGKTTLSTTENNVTIATPLFSKTTTYIEDYTVSDLTYSDAKALEVDTENGVIVASPKKEFKSATNSWEVTTAVGKHTIEVVAVSEDGMYASRAKVTVNVVKGIESLEVTVPSDSIYKAYGKAATLKAVLTYNGGNKADMPKNKNVSWELVKADDDAKYDTTGMVNVKNGTVSIDKGYRLGVDDDDNTFRIKVTAADVTAATNDDNVTVAYSAPITITDTPQDLKGLAIVAGDGRILAVSGKPAELEASKLQGTRMVALNSAGKKAADDAPDLASVSLDSNMQLKDTVLTYKSGNKAVAVNEDKDGYHVLTVSKTAKKVKITATANDGSKAKADITFDVNFDAVPEDLDLQISVVGTESDIYNPNKESNPAKDAIKYGADGTARIYVDVLRNKAIDGMSDAWNDAPAFTDCSLKFTNAKVISQSNTCADIVTDKEAVTITLKQTGKDDKVYTVTNTLYKGSGTAPGVTIKGSLSEQGKADDQTLTVQFKKPAELGEGNTHAKVEVDYTAMTAKNKDAIENFNAQINSGETDPKVFAITNGSFDLTFAGMKAAGDTPEEEEEEQPGTVALSDDGPLVMFASGNYKLKITVGKIVDGKFVDAKDLKSSAATAKVDKAKAFTFKPATSYTISTMDGGAPITAKASVPGYDVTYQLYNDNQKGVTNHFTTYFELSADRKKLQLNKTYFDNETKLTEFIANADNKKQLTGYLRYNAKPGTKHAIGSAEGYVKITVKLETKKPALKYTVDKTTIRSTANSTTAPLAIKVNGDTVKVKYAAVEAPKAGKDVEWSVTVAENKVTLKTLTKLTKNSASANIYVVPENSFYLGEFAKEGANTEALARTYGAKLTVQLTVIPVIMHEVTITADANVDTVKYSIFSLSSLESSSEKEVEFSAADSDGIRTATIPVEECDSLTLVVTPKTNYDVTVMNGDYEENGENGAYLIDGIREDTTISITTTEKAQQGGV